MSRRPERKRTQHHWRAMAHCIPGRCTQTPEAAVARLLCQRPLCSDGNWTKQRKGKPTTTDGRGIDRHLIGESRWIVACENTRCEKSVQRGFSAPSNTRCTDFSAPSNTRCTDFSHTPGVLGIGFVVRVESDVRVVRCPFPEFEERGDALMIIFDVSRFKLFSPIALRSFHH